MLNLQPTLAERRALTSPRGSAASWHVGGLIPAEQRPCCRKVADFKQAEFEFGKFRLGRLALTGGLRRPRKITASYLGLV
jgi:hypothetical protein